MSVIIINGSRLAASSLLMLLHLGKGADSSDGAAESDSVLSLDRSAGRSFRRF